MIYAEVTYLDVNNLTIFFSIKEIYLEKVKLHQNLVNSHVDAFY